MGTPTGWAGPVKQVRGKKTRCVAIAVGVVATELAPADGKRLRVIINNAGQNSFYIGDENVTAATGVEVASGETFTDDTTFDSWYAIMSAGQGDARVIIVDADR